MNLVDILLAAGILAAAGWIFYRSFIRGKGSGAGCSGCASQSCGDRHNGRNNQLIRLSEK